MINVVIVEDETLVRLGLRACLEAYGNIVVSGAFATAEEAEEQIGKIPVDILLTDIRLPEKSGLDLMRGLKEKFPGILFVVLSCYEDFTYAKKAIEYGAVRYILKHELDEIELPAILSELMEDREVLSASQAVEDTGDFNAYIHKIFLENIQSKVLYFEFKRLADAGEEGENADLNMGLARCIIQEQLDVCEMGRAFLYGSSELIAFVKDGDTQDIENLLQRVRAKIKMYADSDCFIGVSDHLRSEDEVNEQICKAKERERYSFYYKSGRVFFEDIPVNNCPRLKFYREDAWSVQWFENTVNDIRRFIQMCSSVRPQPDEVLEAAMRFIQDMIFYGENYCDIKREEVFADGGNPTYAKIYQFHSIKALEMWMINVVEIMVRYIEGRLNLHYKIKVFLDEHYMDELTQTEVAAHFNMGAPYFSTCFKQIFGINYTSYLNQIRIEKAKILLATTNDSAEKIGITVGITNVNYFFRQFKKIEGCTVNEYRKKYNSHLNCAQML